MTDAAVPVTQSAVERFTEQYLRSLGCVIEKRGDTWEISVPEDVDTELSPGTHTVTCDDAPDARATDEMLLHPESQLFQSIVSEASERKPTGKISLGTDNTQVELPVWLRAGDVDVTDTQFSPYYDRSALVVLFRVSIETVSEYQREFLRAVAMDVRSEAFLPKLEETFLELTSLDGKSVESDSTEFESTTVRARLEAAHDRVVDRMQAKIDEVHQEASRAADAEVEEYRRMQEQRIQELESKRADLSAKIDELSERVNGGGQAERVEALKERKERKSEYEEVDAELTDLRERREQGFPERQRDIRKRHALEVRVIPLTVTEVAYERGEIEIDLAESGTTRTLTLGYGSGVGVTEEARCSSCNRAFTEQNPLQTIRDGLLCQACAVGN